MTDPANMQPHELAAELGVEETSLMREHHMEVKWMRAVVALQRRIERLEAVNKRQLEYYRNPPETKR